MGANATVLHVGNDLTYRIPVMERAGLAVFRSECSANGIRSAFREAKTFHLIAFPAGGWQSDSPGVVSTARSLTNSPLVLLGDPPAELEVHGFDLIIPAYTDPAVWLKSLTSAIEEARKLAQRSRELREECADVRAASWELQARSARNRTALISPWTVPDSKKPGE
jgi:hypothetical protein